MAFLAFTVSMIIGLWVDNPFTTVIGRSLLMMFIFYALGATLSLIGQKVIRENFDAEAQRLSQSSEAQAEEVIEVPQDVSNENLSETQQPEPALSNG